MEEFNPQIFDSDLPEVESLSFQKLEKDYLMVLLIAAAIRSTILITVLLLAYIMVPYDVPDGLFKFIGIWFFLYLIWTFIKTIKGFYCKEYALREKDIVYKTGWLWKSMTTTPFNRVQHITIEHGLIERQFKLARLKVFTAGGSSSDLTIPGIRPETANKLKEFIVKKTQSDEEE